MRGTLALDCYDQQSEKQRAAAAARSAVMRVSAWQAQLLQQNRISVLYMYEMHIFERPQGPNDGHALPPLRLSLSAVNAFGGQNSSGCKLALFFLLLSVFAIFYLRENGKVEPCERGVPRLFHAAQ